MIKKIILVGEGGQGIKLIAHSLASILATLGKNITLTYNYDAAVRGGNITASLIYSDSKIENPIIDVADILLMLSEVTGFSAKKIIIEKTIFKEGNEKLQLNCADILAIPLMAISSEKFASQIFVNMIALGQMLKQVGIDITKIDFSKVLPENYLEKNIEAVKFGYGWKL